MKFSIAVASIFAARVLAQASVITDAVAAIQSATSALDTDVKGYNGGSPTELEAAASSVLSAITAGNSAVSGISTQLTVAQAAGLITPIKALAAVIDTTVTDTISQKSVFDGANVGGEILSDLQGFQDAAKTFSATIVSKIPSGLANIANSLSAPIIASLQRGIDAYSGESSSPSGGSSSASASATGSSTPASSSAASSSAVVSSVPVVTPSGYSPPAYTSKASSSTPVAYSPSSSAPTPSAYPGAAAQGAVAGFGGLAVAAIAAMVAL